MREAILARHGESDFSRLGLTNGDPTAAVGLTEKGEHQSRELGRELAGTPIDLCVTSEFLRAHETADIALEGRRVPRLVVRELNDVRFGRFEGRPLTEYRAWAHSTGPTEQSPDGGESRAETVARFVRGYRVVLARPEETVLVIAHGLPVRYALDAVSGADPRPIVENVEYAHPYRLSAEELARAVDRLDAWSARPSWATEP